MKVALIKETKLPVDRRVALNPQQVAALAKKYPQHTFVVESSPFRAFADAEYAREGVEVVVNIRDCDILLGVKEVDLEEILSSKTYLFFSHTAKQQSHNQKLLQTLSHRGNTLIDYEYLTNSKNQRLVAFGYWAGVVGAYNGLRAYGLKYGQYSLKAPEECKGLEELSLELEKISQEISLKIIVTGEGRVASGAKYILDKAGIQKLSSKAFFQYLANKPCYVQIGPQHYTRHPKKKAFDLEHFINNPGEYLPAFKPYWEKGNVFIACHFWDEQSPAFFTGDDLRKPNFNLKLIADISCDLKGPIPTTLRASTHRAPFYGVNPTDLSETKPFVKDMLTVMAVDNLPGAIPREASTSFGDSLIGEVLPALLDSNQSSQIINRATILKEGALTDRFNFLSSYLEGVIKH